MVLLKEWTIGMYFLEIATQQHRIVTYMKSFPRDLIVYKRDLKQTGFSTSHKEYQASSQVTVIQGVANSYSINGTDYLNKQDKVPETSWSLKCLFFDMVMGMARARYGRTRTLNYM